jgi:uncharacterized protein YkwD
MTCCLLILLSIDTHYHLWFHQTIEEHNVVRRNYGLQILELDEKLMKEASDHAIWMTKNEIMQHSKIRYGAENIAKAKMSPKRVVQLWMNSQGHRRNILNPRYTKIGVAVYKSKSGRYYWCARFR